MECSRENHRVYDVAAAYRLAMAKVRVRLPLDALSVFDRSIAM